MAGNSIPDKSRQEDIGLSSEILSNWGRAWERVFSTWYSIWHRLSSFGYRAWQSVVYVFTILAWLTVPTLNFVMFPQGRSGRPHWVAILVWGLLNIALVSICSLIFGATYQIGIGLLMAALHFVVINTAFLVIAEENDVWGGYVRFDPDEGSSSRDERVFKKGQVAKSLPLMLTSGTSYLLFLAVALHGLHEEYLVLKIDDHNISYLKCLFTVLSQIPAFDGVMNRLGISGIESGSWVGTAFNYGVRLSMVSIVLATFSSLLRQKLKIRRLIEGLGADRGDIPFLQQQASRAPHEIKTSIIDMAVNHPEAVVRHRAMAVAPHLAILTFPKTIVYNLHKEPVEENKVRALSASIKIITKTRVDVAFRDNLLSSIDYQLQLTRKKKKVHNDRILGLLNELRESLISGANR